MLSAGQGPRWEPDSSSPSTGRRGASQHRSPLPNWDAAGPTEGAFAFQSPMGTPCAPPEELCSGLGAWSPPTPRHLQQGEK